jgi:hypothetical protein
MSESISQAKQKKLNKPTVKPFRLLPMMLVKSHHLWRWYFTDDIIVTEDEGVVMRLISLTFLQNMFKPVQRVINDIIGIRH